ncbi:MAG: hypothetical protein LUH22_16290 [Bacteroides sp.]|nr:hypothetical protein [Bacteroides sp.]
MKFVKIAISLTIVLVILSSFSLKNGSKDRVYAFGLSASFTDTVVYHTGIQLLDSVELEKGFLPHRDLYSYQLKNYLEYQKGQKNRTCMIYFSRNKAKLEKEKAKLLAKYKKDKGTVLREISFEEFAFKKPEGD